MKESNFTEEEEMTFGSHKIYVEYKPDADEQTEISFNIKTLYQGPEYEDPNPPEEEEVKKKPPAKGKPAEVTNEKPPIRMIKPDPILMTAESGRTFQFEIGRMMKFQIRPESAPDVISQDIQSQANTNNQNSSPNLHEGPPKWQRYHFDQRPLHLQSKQSRADSTMEQQNSAAGEDSNKTQVLEYVEPTEDMLYTVASKEGVCSVSGIRFVLTNQFTGGAYTVICRDVTKGLPPRMLMKTIKILLKIKDLSEPKPTEVHDAKAAPAKKGKK